MEHWKAEERAVGDMNFSEWNYGADLDLIKAGLSMATGQEQECVRVRSLITTCVSLIRKQFGSMESKATEDVSIQNVEQLVRCRNPLKIHLILYKVLSYIPVKYLLTCRLVNSSWNATSLPWIRKKAQTQVCPFPEELPMFFADFDSTEVLPIRSFKINLQDMNNYYHCQKFFIAHGPQLDKLEINDRNYYKEIRVPSRECLKTLQHILRNVPNLKTLDLNFEYPPNNLGPFDFDEGQESVILSQVEYLTLWWRGSFSQGFLDGLSTLLPNLKVIHFENTNDSRRKEQDWETFGNFLGQCLSLHTIHCPVHISSYIEANVLFRSMTTQGFPKLKELYMCLNLYLLNSLNNEDLRLVEAQEEFLRSQSDNLEVLRLNIVYTNSNLIVQAQQKRQFPVMKYLKTAIFDNLYKNQHSIYTYVQLEPEHLPNLQTLCVIPKIMENEVFADSIFFSVQEVVLLPQWSLENFDLLPKIGSRFPNLRKLSNLEIRLDVKAMETIVRNFPGIEDLELKIAYKLQNFNLVIGGIPIEKGTLGQDNFKPCAGYESLPFLVDQPGSSLRDLKCLKKLVLEYGSFGQKILRSIRIDEIGVYLTFLRLSPQLNLTFRGGFLISDKLAAKLRGHYQNIYFIPPEL